MDARMRSGTRLLEMFWYITADRIVNKAIQLYSLDEERAEILRRKFLRPGDYSVTVRKNL